MAFRIETRIGAIVVFTALLAGAQEVTVRHRHLRHGGSGMLRVSADGVSFSEEGKQIKHSRKWSYQEIQQLELASGTLRILTYEDQKWKLGRDREYVFDRLPEGFARTVREQWSSRLDQRFVSGLAAEPEPPLWEVPSKLLAPVLGSQGVISVGTNWIVYRTEKPEQSRTWRFADIENIASAGPFDFSVVTREHHGAWNQGSREFRFQLKQPLPEARYNDLWQRLNLSRESEFTQSSIETKEHD